MKTLILAAAILSGTPQTPPPAIPNVEKLVSHEWAVTRITAYGIEPSPYRDDFPTRYGTSGRAWQAGSRRVGSPSGADPVHSLTRYHTASESTLLSLQPTSPSAHASGKAWIVCVKESTLNRQRTALEAFKGTYEFLPDAVDDDNLVLYLGFTRKYEGKFSGPRIVWTHATAWEPKGVRIDVPLFAGQLPKGELTFSAVEGLFVDARGQAIADGAAAHDLANRLQRRSKRIPRDTEFFRIGQTLHFQQDLGKTLLTKHQLISSPPPSFVSHAAREAEKSQKPATPAADSKDAIKITQMK